MADLDIDLSLDMIAAAMAEQARHLDALVAEMNRLVAVVRAAQGIAERFADEEALAGSPLKALRDALAPFGGDQ